MDSLRARAITMIDSMSDEAVIVDRTEPRSPLGWASFLGASWTWCIGMFLPVLLIRDYGLWAWVIFAIPNCIGAAAMGWTMRSAEQSRRFVVDHAVACRLFSLVTIAFHLFFLTWMLPRLVGPWGYVGSAILVQAAFTPLTRSRVTLVLSAITLLVSASVAVVLASTTHTLHPPQVLLFPAGDMLGLALVCLLGFALCPYLDLTFHRARQNTTDAGAKIAFGVGFCVLFASMIVLTLFYAEYMNPSALLVGGISGWLIAIHLTVQAAFTVNVHAASLVKQAEARDDVGVMRSALGASLAVGLLAAFASFFAAEQGISYRSGHMTIGEVFYRCFMSFYGLVAPAYMMILLFRGRPRAATWIVLCLLAIPFYWIGFIEKQMAWTAAGVAVVIAGAFIVARIKSPAPASPSA